MTETKLEGALIDNQAQLQRQVRELRRELLALWAVCFALALSMFLHSLPVMVARWTGGSS